MALLAPWFLTGLLALGLPLWLHLLRRRSPVRLRFSSLMFFRQRTEDTVRERRLQHWALLALRLALLALLALAFSAPIWERPPAALGASRPTLAIVVLDTSLSMQYGDRWNGAVRAAERILDGLGDRDRAQLLANGPAIRALTEPTNDRNALRRALNGLAPTDARNSYGDVVEAVRNLVPDDGSAVALHLVSDFQQTAMPTRFQDLVLPPAATLTLHDIASEPFANWAIESVKGTARLWGAARPRLEATVVSYADEPMSKTVTLRIEERLAGSRTLEVPAGGRAAFGFEIADAPRGFSRAEFRLERADALPADDLRRVALDNSEPAPLLFVTPDARRRDLLYYRSALEAGAGQHYRLDSVSPAEAERLDPSRYALVVLSDVPQLGQRFGTRLRAWVASGGAALIALGSQSALARRSVLTGHAVVQPLADERGGEAFQVAGQADSSHPAAGAAEDLRSAKFFLYARVQLQAGDEAPLRLGNGDPLLVDHPLGKGRTLIFASSLDNVWNDLPLSPVFVPFVTETARYLTRTDTARGAALLGEVLELGRRRSAGASVQVIDPAGERILTLSEAARRETVPLEAVGFYRIQEPDRSELVAVNPDPRESNLRRAEADALALWQSTGAAGPAGAAPAAAGPVETPPWRIWRALLLLLVGITLLESFVGNRHMGAIQGN